AIFAAAISAPVLTGALMDHSVVSVQGAPGSGGGCGGLTCSVGGQGQGGVQSGQAQGGHAKTATGFGNGASVSGTFAGVYQTLSRGPSLALTGTGRRTAFHQPTGEILGSQSGNFTTIPGNGHCTGNTFPCG